MYVFFFFCDLFTWDLSKMTQLWGHSPKLVDVDLSDGDLIETRICSIPFGLWSPQVGCCVTGILWGGFGLLICGVTNVGFLSGKGLQQTCRSFEQRLCKLSTMTSVLGIIAFSLMSMAKGSWLGAELLISPLHCWNVLFRVSMYQSNSIYVSYELTYVGIRKVWCSLSLQINTLRVLIDVYTRIFIFREKYSLHDY